MVAKTHLNFGFRVWGWVYRIKKALSISVYHGKWVTYMWQKTILKTQSHEQNFKKTSEIRNFFSEKHFLKVWYIRSIPTEVFPIISFVYIHNVFVLCATKIVQRSGKHQVYLNVYPSVAYLIKITALNAVYFATKIMTNRQMSLQNTACFATFSREEQL